MKRFFDKLRNKKTLSFDKEGVLVSNSKGNSIVVDWDKINKVVFVDTFEEYSGYFLTEEYKNKELYKSIKIACNQNVVKIRTGGAPTIKNNTSEPFSRDFGTTSIYYPVFIEYLDAEGSKNLYATHYDEGHKKQLIKEFKEILGEDRIRFKKRLEGFNPLSII